MVSAQWGNKCTYHHFSTEKSQISLVSRIQLCCCYPWWPWKRTTDVHKRRNITIQVQIQWDPFSDAQKFLYLGHKQQLPGSHLNFHSRLKVSVSKILEGGSLTKRSRYMYILQITALLFDTALKRIWNKQVMCTEMLSIKIWNLVVHMRNIWAPITTNCCLWKQFWFQSGRHFICSCNTFIWVASGPQCHWLRLCMNNADHLMIDLYFPYLAICLDTLSDWYLEKHSVNGNSSGVVRIWQYGFRKLATSFMFSFSFRFWSWAVKWMFCLFSDRIWKASNEYLLKIKTISQYAACCKISSIKCNIVQEYPAEKLPWGFLCNEVKVCTCTYSSRINIHLPWLTEQIMGKQIENVEDMMRWRKGS